MTISFIVIGRNEGWKLKRCFNSIRNCIFVNRYSAWEIIYVDSKSTDGSLDVAATFPEVRTFQVTGEQNAAIARNIGAAESTGDVLFFIDGDMEIQADFLPLVYSESGGLTHPFVSGNWINIHYETFETELPLARMEKAGMKADAYQFTVGGLFLIERAIWFEAGGMRTKFRRSQDWELAFRLAAKGVFLFRKKEILAHHHTISPMLDNKRAWYFVLTGGRYYRAVIMRDHLLNRYQWAHFAKTHYTFILFWLAAAASVHFSQPALMLSYWAALTARSYVRKQRDPRTVLSNLLMFTVYELGYLLAFLFFWPPSPEVRYRRVEPNLAPES